MGTAARISADGACRHEESTIFLSPPLLVEGPIWTPVSSMHSSLKTLFKRYFEAVFQRSFLTDVIKWKAPEERESAFKKEKKKIQAEQKKSEKQILLLPSRNPHFYSQFC